MKYDTKDVSARLKGARECLDITTAEMAEKTKVAHEDYLALESGERDFSLSFLNDCAAVLDIELIALLTGGTPKLRKYSLIKDGQGLPIERRAGFAYQHMAHLFKGKKAEPFMVTAPYIEAEQDAAFPVALSTHDGHEMDIVLSGKLRFVIDGKTEILEPGDCIYFDAAVPHGMVATGGADCKFLAVLV